MLKKHIVAIVIALVGIACHVAGVTLDQTMVDSFAHTAGVMFDLAAIYLVGAKLRQRGDDDDDTPTGGATIAMMFIVLAVMVACAGCATSKAFQGGAHVVGQGIAETAAGYVAANPTTLPADEVDRRAAQLESFRLATVRADAITYEAVQSSWGTIRNWYLAYVNADPRLARMPTTLKYYRLEADVMSRLIQAEGVRRLIWGDDAAVEAIAAEASE